MFELYLDIQKQKALEELSEDEVKGRWKSFVGKWYISTRSLWPESTGTPRYKRLTFVRNRGELAEGWYDPPTLQKAQVSAASNAVNTERQSRPRDSPSYGSPSGAEESSGEDVVGPTMPGYERQVYKSNKRPGPAIPNLQDLELQRGMAPGRTCYPNYITDSFASHKELEQEDSAAHRQDLREHRHLDRKQQKERLDDLAPRAEAGSKDRILEKKREKADSNRAFASAKTEAGGVEEVPESDLLGDEDGGIEGFKKQKREMDRKKNERELRREEVMRARMEELEERRRNYRAKEEKTMSGLVALAKARFG
ncbi:MAG: hypothetical protein Q9161_009076 [Pseudevernia consocians]